MLLSDYTLNMLTLAALTISIGRVVDDSIVVIENITRHLTYGKTRMRAVADGVREVAGAITAATLATVVVFLPVAVVSGWAGELLRPFALTVAIAMLASLVVALTIVPVLAYWFLRAPQAPPPLHPGAELGAGSQAHRPGGGRWDPGRHRRDVPADEDQHPRRHRPEHGRLYPDAARGHHLGGVLREGRRRRGRPDGHRWRGRRPDHHRRLLLRLRGSLQRGHLPDHDRLRRRPGGVGRADALHLGVAARARRDRGLLRRRSPGLLDRGHPGHRPHPGRPGRRRREPRGRAGSDARLHRRRHL